MNVRALGAAVTVVVVIALAALGLPRLTGQAPGTNPSASPAPTPIGSSIATASARPTSSPNPTAATTASPTFPVHAGPPPFTQVHYSDLYHYGMRYPSSWTLNAGAVANAPDGIPDLGSVPPRTDFYGDDNTSGVMVTAGPASATRPDTATFSAFVGTQLPKRYTIYAGGGCTRSTRPVDLDGEPATEFDFLCPAHTALWIAAVHHGIAYQVAWLDDGAFTLGDLRAKFDQFLQSFTFAP